VNFCPVSIICRSLFNDAKHIMCEDRRHMDPGTLVMLLLLKYNKDLWDSRTIDIIISKESAVDVGQKRPWV